MCSSRRRFSSSTRRASGRRPASTATIRRTGSRPCLDCVGRTPASARSLGDASARNARRRRRARKPRRRGVLFLPPPHDLAPAVRRRSRSPCCSRPPTAGPCDELHREGFKRPKVSAPRTGSTSRASPSARPTPLDDACPERATDREARGRTSLGVTYTPTLDLLRRGRPRGVPHRCLPAAVSSSESSLDYVASGAYRDEPSFQRC